MLIKRFVSLTLSGMLLLCLLISGILFVSAGREGEKVYATLVTASDFQGGNGAYENFSTMLGTIETAGYGRPDGFLLGGDYGDETVTDSDASVDRLMTLICGRYSQYPRENIIIARGNHDGESDSLNTTGLSVFPEYLVYTIDYSDFPDGQYWRADCADKVRETAITLENVLSDLAEGGERRPVFIVSHIPLHHSGRSKYGENLYSKHLFDVLNTLGEELDLIFLFGHNHSGDYDDYIGGSVNLLGRGETIRIPRPHTLYQGEAGYTNETLEFTYANYGYVGYANNSVNEATTNVLTTGLWEIRPTDIRLYRYTEDGLYSVHVIRRNHPTVETPYVSLDGDLSLSSGTVSTVSATVRNFTNPRFCWTVDDPSIAELSYTGAQAQILCLNPGSTMLTLTVTDSTGAEVTERICVTVKASAVQESTAELFLAARPINNKTLYFYDVKPGDELSFEIRSTAAHHAQISWNSSDFGVAVVSTGVVQFLAEGQTVISFSSNDGVNSISAQVTLVVSGKPKPTFVLEENGEGLCARSDGILLTGWHTRLNDDGTSSCYYFDPDTGYAVDGTCLIDGHSYIFSQHILVQGDLCTDGAGSCYYWAGELLKNCWICIGDDRYYAMNSGYFATGLQWVLNPAGDAYAGYVFDDHGMFCDDLSGLYHQGTDTYYISEGLLVKEAGLVYVDGAYYFFPGGSTAVKNMGYWVYKTNGLLPEGLYYFDAEGRMIDPPEIYYQISWVIDGNVIIESFRSGELPEYMQGEAPEKAPTEYSCYYFIGWEPPCEIATQDAVYTAVFEAPGHSIQSQGEPAACTTDGWERNICLECGFVTSETILPAQGHSYETSKILPTCAKGGYTAHICSDCGAYFRSNFSAPTGHINLHRVVVPSTCTEKGSITYICVCGKVVAVKTTKALGHRYSYANMGETHYVSCVNGCGSVFSKGHSYLGGNCVCGAEYVESAEEPNNRCFNIGNKCRKLTIPINRLWPFIMYILEKE